MTTNIVPQWSGLLADAVSKPGTLSKAYNAFHRYSIGNQILAYSQCIERDIEPGPIATYPAWKYKGRHVKKGEKALILCMPVTCKRKEEDENGEETEAVFTRFIFKPRWFVLSQTEGAEYSEPTAIP